MQKKCPSSLYTDGDVENWKKTWIRRDGEWMEVLIWKKILKKAMLKNELQNEYNEFIKRFQHKSVK